MVVRRDEYRHLQCQVLKSAERSWRGGRIVLVFGERLEDLLLGCD
jgi:hypothetical protein